MYFGILLINIVFFTFWTKYYLSYLVRLYAKAFKKKFPKQYEILVIFLKKTSSKIVNKNTLLGKFLSRREEPKIKENKDELSRSVRVKSFEKIGYEKRKIKKIGPRALSPKKMLFPEKK